MLTKKKKSRGFSLIELVIVVVIIAIIAAIAVPKMSRGAAGASDAALMQNVAQMRSAIDLFVTEHGGAYPSQTPLTFIDQLTKYSDVTGATSATKTTTHIYGPYLKTLPPLPVGSLKGQSSLTYNAAGPGTGAFAWCYDGTSIYANLPATEKDIKDQPYNTY